MKTKLLKKIRKSFNWYINPSGFPVLINHLNRTVTLINVAELKRYYDYKDDSYKESVEVTMQEWAWRNLKQRMYKKFGYDITNHWYNMAVRKEKYGKIKTIKQ